MREFILNFSEVKPGERVLDIGCGTGEQAVYFAKKGAIEEHYKLVAKKAKNV